MGRGSRPRLRLPAHPPGMDVEVTRAWRLEDLWI